MNLVVSHWSANPAVLAVYVAVVAVYLRGFRAAAATAGAGRRGRVAQAVAFHAGLLVVLLALVSPAGYWSREYVWVRSLQDLSLAFFAPSLIVLGAPWLALARGARLPRAAGPGRPGQTASPPGPVRMRWPMVVTVAFCVAWWGWHMPALYDAALRDPAVYAAEVVTYLGLGIALWLQLIGSWPFTPRLGPVQRVMVVAALVVMDTVLAMVLAFGSGVLYPAYVGAGHHILSVVADQQVGGAVLWVLALPPLTIAGVALLLTWFSEEESQALTAGFGRLLGPAKPAWPSGPARR